MCVSCISVTFNTRIEFNASPKLAGKQVKSACVRICQLILLKNNCAHHYSRTVLTLILEIRYMESHNICFPDQTEIMIYSLKKNCHCSTDQEI